MKNKKDGISLVDGIDGEKRRGGLYSTTQAHRCLGKRGINGGTTGESASIDTSGIIETP